MKKQRTKHLLFIMALAMVCLFIPAKTLHAASGQPENPRYDTNGNPEWDYVYFGKYPQSEVDMNEIPEATESKLRNAVYNVNGDAVIDGIKYRRVSYYDEDDYDCTTNLYRYFRYDPIKWRVLNNSGRSLLLLSDSCLLYEPTSIQGAYNNPEYATSKQRSVLNGYRASENAENAPGIDYSQKGTNFYSMAFTKSEQEILEKQTLPEDVGKTDYITIPTEKQISNEDYGFQNAADRAAGGSDYLKFFYSQIGTVDENFPIGYDVLRTSRHVQYNCNSQTFSDYYRGILRPVITISLNSDLWSMENPGNTYDAMDISLADINMPRDTFTYNGKACEPVITSAKYNSENLQENIDYTCSYDNNTNAGEASVIIQGTGDYIGSITKPFTISKASQSFNIQQKYQKTYGDKSFKLNPKPRNGNGAFTYNTSNSKVAKVSKNGAITITGCGKAVVTTTMKASNNYKQTQQKTTIIVVPKRAALSKPQSKAKGQLMLKWKKDAKASGYEISYTINGKKKTKLVKTNRSTSITIKKLKSKANCSVKIRSYTLIDGQKQFGKYSSVKKVRIK